MQDSNARLRLFLVIGACVFALVSVIFVIFAVLYCCTPKRSLVRKLTRRSGTEFKELKSQDDISQSQNSMKHQQKRNVGSIRPSLKTNPRLPSLNVISGISRSQRPTRYSGRRSSDATSELRTRSQLDVEQLYAENLLRNHHAYGRNVERFSDSESSYDGFTNICFLDSELNTKSHQYSTRLSRDHISAIAERRVRQQTPPILASRPSISTTPSSNKPHLPRNNPVIFYDKRTAL